VPKVYLGMNVLSAAKERISWAFDTFKSLYVSFSGGKDSTVMLHLVMEEAIARNRTVGVMFIDWECQFTATIDHIEAMYTEYKSHIVPYWIALPMRTWNGCSQIEPEWTAWEESKRPLWVRDKHPMSIQTPESLPFYREAMTFEEFVPEFGRWYANGEECGCFVGIRAGESLNRFRTIARQKDTNDGKKWTTNVIDDVWNIYPIYDWQTQDDWVYLGKFQQSYNKLYDRMHQAGMTIHQMRVDEPFGDTQRVSLWMYQVIEPQMWSKITARVAGASTGAIYAKERGNVLGNDKLKLPEGHTWESFAKFLLATIPPATSNHYKNKLAVYLKWHMVRGYENGIPDEADYKLETYGKVPSWRRICKSLLRNDYWCRGLGFSPTKNTAYAKYTELMKKRRATWGLFKDDLDEADSVE
jgi:predicted phosphoadenosine phosphosulfate sulfurtransferase